MMKIMLGKKYQSNNPAMPSTRVERLLRERELRKNSRVSQSCDALDVLARRTELPEIDLLASESDTSKNAYVEQYLEDAMAAGSLNDVSERPEERQIMQRLLEVANRLPVSAVRRGEQSWTLEISAGGVKEVEARWIGWAGVNVPDEAGQTALTKALAEKRCIPVFLDEEIVHQYYNGYCNNILWPLFHYLGLPQEDGLATTRSFESQFAAYKKANQMFADVVTQHYYHLIFLPESLKKHNSSLKVGWFLHTPFPSSEIHRTLPSRSELLRAVLAADLVG